MSLKITLKKLNPKFLTLMKGKALMQLQYLKETYPSKSLEVACNHPVNFQCRIMHCW